MTVPLSTLGSITLTQLAYAVAVDTHRHFGAAAAECNVTQPTLSMQLRKLEAALGITLFDRSRAPVVPTDAGRALIEQARVVLREAAGLADVRDAEAGVIAGEVRFGVIPTLAPYLLPRLVPLLAKKFPRLELIVEERVTDEIISRLRRDALDAGVVATPVGGADVFAQALFVEPFVGYVSNGHRLAHRASIRTSDLSLDDLWLLSEGHCFRAQAVKLCRQRSTRARSADACTVGARFESGNLETLKRLVDGGAGMTLLPWLATEEMKSDRLKPFVAPAPSRSVRLVRRRAFLRQHLIDAVVAELMANLPAGLVTKHAKRSKG